MGKIRVGIIGVGNCASSFVQGVHYYRNAKETDFVPGLMHVNLGGYHIRDIEFSAAIDIDKNKVGRDLAEAIYTWPNNTYKFSDVPRLGVPVARGMTHDGLGQYLSKIIHKAPGSTADIVRLLKETKTDVVINYLNMLERSRLESKKISKTNAVTSMLDYDIGEKNVHIGPSDYVEWLDDRKWAYIRLEGRTFGDVPLNVEMKLEVWDSPNSAGVVIDAVRMVKLALDRGISGTLEGPSAYLMKSPPIQYHDDIAREMTETFIREEAYTAPQEPEVLEPTNGHKI